MPSSVRQRKSSSKRRQEEEDGPEQSSPVDAALDTSMVSRSSSKRRRSRTSLHKEAEEESWLWLPTFDIYEHTTLDNFILVAFTAGCLVVNLSQQRVLNNVYASETWHCYDHLVKICMSYFGHATLKRSLTRNLFFNTLRCMTDEVYFYLLLGVVTPWSIVAFRLFTVFALTMVVQNGFDREAAMRNPKSYSLMVILWVMSLPIQFTRNVSQGEALTDGNFVKLLIFIHCMIVTFLYGEMLEDFIFGGLNKIGGVWHNWDFFMPPYAVVLASYALGHRYYGHSVHGVWRHPTSSISSSISETGQFPLMWPSVTYADQERERFAMVLIAHLIFAITILYLQIKWSHSIKEVARRNSIAAAATKKQN